MVLLTDTTSRRLLDRVDIDVQSGRGIPGLFAIHATTLVVLEVLVLGIAASNRSAADASLERLNGFEQLLPGESSMWTPLEPADAPAMNEV